MTNLTIPMLTIVPRNRTMLNLAIAFAPINTTVGALSANCKKIVDAIHAARAAQADVVLFPELCLTGYIPEDLLLRADFQQAIENQREELIQASINITAIVGLPTWQAGCCFNSALVLQNGQCVGIYHKNHLPNYGVFDEKRYFVEGDSPLHIRINDTICSVCICEDLWHPSTAKKLAAQADCLLSLNASPFEMKKHENRIKTMEQTAAANNCAIAYCNMTGGQDEVVFDGDCFIIDEQGQQTYQSPFFADRVLIANTHAVNPSINNTVLLTRLHQALTLSIQDYVYKNGFEKIVLGLSGGIDSALCLSLCTSALGNSNITAVTMPSIHTASLSIELAEQQCQTLGVELLTLPIRAVVDSFTETLQGTQDTALHTITYQNLQARTRGTLLMGLANEHHSLVITTGNKSEYATGYCTLYGDMAGAFAPLKDLDKTTVYSLARHINDTIQQEHIPQAVIDRPPTAELIDNQKDSDSLPEYDTLDDWLRTMIEADSAHQNEAQLAMLRKIVLNEYKRRQSAPGPKVSPRAFGRERRYPITQAFF